MSSKQARNQLDSWGGAQFIYSCSAQLVSFEIDCFYGLRTQIYMNMCPPPIIELATKGLLLKVATYATTLKEDAVVQAVNGYTYMLVTKTKYGHLHEHIMVRHT